MVARLVTKKLKRWLGASVLGGTGRLVARATKCALCRCGGSKTKPYCDGSHRTNGFTAP